MRFIPGSKNKIMWLITSKCQAMFKTVYLLNPSRQRVNSTRPSIDKNKFETYPRYIVMNKKILKQITHKCYCITNKIST